MATTEPGTAFGALTPVVFERNKNENEGLWCNEGGRSEKTWDLIH